MSDNEPTNATSPGSSGSSAQSSASSSPASSLPSDKLGRLASLAAQVIITVQWFRGEIPDFRWAIAGVVLATLPAGSVPDVLKETVKRLLPKGK